MGFLDGVTQCWWLSRTCEVNWNAWAAIATTFAAFVALLVGLAPLLLAKYQRARVGRAEARVAAAELKLQGLHVAAALHLLAGNTTSAHVYRLAVAQFNTLDVGACRRVVPYLDVLPKGLEKALSEAICDIGIGMRSLSRLTVAEEVRSVDASGTRELFATLLESIESARRALFAATGSEHAAEALEPGAQQFADQLLAEARAAVVARITSTTHMR